jgi:ribose/xylose/arabinose/galactoside ABC-type transport system permease subunit
MTDQQSTVPATRAHAAEERIEPAPPARRWPRRLSLGRYTGVVVALVAVVIYLTITEPVFMTWDNLMNIVQSNSVIFVLAIGATFVVLSGGIDLSVASATTATAMIFGLALHSGWALLPALLASLGFGLALGLANGVLIAKAHISFLVVTLGALSIWASFALVVNGGQTVSVFSSPAFGPIKDFTNKDVGPIPIVLLFDVLVVLVAGGVLRYTAFGRALFATGSNQEAARLNGISITRILIAVYAIAGLSAGVAAILLVGRLSAAAATSDPTLLLTVLAAVLIGGTSFSGGEGGVLGTVIGVVFLGVVQNGLTLSSVSTFWQGTVSGVILIAAVGLGVLRDRGYTLRPRRAVPAPAEPAAVEPR